MNALIPQSILGERLGPEQASYLEGFFKGLEAKGVTFGDVVPAPGVAEEDDSELTAEERIKRGEHPLDSYYRIAENARARKSPEKEEVFRFKWHGLFYLSPVKDAFMARLRIPGGQLTAYQLHELALVAEELTSGYVQVTTRANFQIRLIEPAGTVEFLRRVQRIGLHTRGAGADNIRNITCNPTAGIDPAELIDCSTYVRELADIILNHREFYDLPRKFNVAFDGGGLIGSVEDTNDIGIKAVRMGERVAFRVALGGATGHQAFARDAGILVEPDSIVDVVVALIRVFIANGDRTNRKRARLKHLLESWTIPQFVDDAEKLLDFKLERLPLDAGAIDYPSEELPHSHIGVFPQRQVGSNYVGVALPAGQVTPKQMKRLADLATNYGAGEVRLTVWQNLVLPGIPDAYVETVKKALVRMGLDWRQSNVASGIIACTGNRYCKYASTDTKGHALDLSRYLEKHVALDQPVNIHFTGCPHSCAQHYMGDIGLLGTKTRDGTEAYHVFVGGGFGSRQACGRQLFAGMIFEEVKVVLRRMLTRYLDLREGGESFQAYANRHEVGDLQALFTEDA